MEEGGSGLNFSFESAEEIARTTVPILLRLGVAFLCGAMVGLEREIRGKTAGLRTNILICLGAAIYMTVSELVAKYVAHTPSESARIAAGVVTGIGFLGAGAILRSGVTVQGLTTAASIWLVAGIGMAVGAGFPLLGFAATALTLATLILLGRLEEHISGACSFARLEATVPEAEPRARVRLEAVLASAGRHLRVEELVTEGESPVVVFSYCRTHPEHHAFLDTLLAIPEVRIRTLPAKTT